MILPLAPPLTRPVLAPLPEASSICIPPVPKSWTKKMWRFGRKVQIPSSFLYASTLPGEDSCMLTEPHLPFPDWSFLFYSSHFYRYQLPELAARSQRRHPVPPCSDIPTTFQCQFQRPYSPRNSVYHPNSLLSLRFGGIHQLSLVPQSCAQSHMRPYGHTFTTMGSQIPPDGSKKSPTSY